MTKWLLASKNRHKIEEIKTLFKPLNIEIISLLDIDSSLEINETGTTFEENARIKAVTAYHLFQYPTISDDSGLEVFALDLEPGVYSQRYSSSGTDQDNLMKLLSNMTGIVDRRARFVSVICFVDRCGIVHSFRGELYGEIASLPLYDQGFGYDPIFYLPEHQKMLSNYKLDEKNQISHRGIALKKFMEWAGGNDEITRRQ